ncbi:MAG: Zn-binding domain-containing protein [Dyadobacter sp.]
MFKVGIQLGLKKFYRGNPQHIDTAEYKVFNWKTLRFGRYLVLYDKVPGGTGYLEQLFDRDEFSKLLEKAYVAIRDCTCQHDGCYRSIFSYGNQYHQSDLSRKRPEKWFANIVSKTEGLEKQVTGLSDVHSTGQIEESKLEELFVRSLRKLAARDKNWLFKEVNDDIVNYMLNTLQEYLNVSRTGRGKPVTRRQRGAIWQLVEKYNERKFNINCLHKQEVYNRVANYLTFHNTRPFSYVIVDELQDFSNVELRFIRSLTEEKENDLFLVGDPLQSIYDKKINFSKAGINIRGNRSKRLRINYRTTEEIKKLAISIIEDCHYDNFDGEEEDKKGYISLVHDRRPAYEIYKSKTDEVLEVQNKILILLEGVEKYQLSDIAIAARTKEGLKDFKDAFHKNRTPYYENHSNSVEGEKNGIRLVTFQYLRSEKSLLYVASSRAIVNLAISGIGVKSDMIRL